MFERLEQIAARYEELGREMASDEVLTDHERYQKVAKQHRDLEPVVETFREYQRTKQGIADAQTMLAETDPDIRAMVVSGLVEMDRFFARLFKIAQERGELASTADPQVLANLASATIHTIAIRARAQVPRTELQAIVNGAIGVMLRG